MVNKLTKSDECTLCGKKLKMAEMLANPEFTGTNKELYEKLGISHQTFYKWIREEAIISHAEYLIEKYTDAELSSVWKALLKKCRDGDTQAIKLYFELKGKYKQEVKQTIDTNTMGVIMLPEIKGDSDVSADI